MRICRSARTVSSSSRRVAAAAGEDPAHLVRVHVEDRGDVEAALFEAPVGEQGPAQVADAHQAHVLDVVGADDLADGAAHLLDVVAAGDVAVAAEAGQVAAELRGGDTHQGGELVGVDVLDLVGAQLFELAPVDAEPLHRVEGDLLVLFAVGAMRLPRCRLPTVN